MEDGLIGRPQKNPGGLFFIVLPLLPFNGVPSCLCCIHFGIKSFCIFRQLLLFSPLCLPLFLCSSLSSTIPGGDDADSLGCPGPSPPWRGEFARRAAHSRKRRWNIGTRLSVNLLSMHHINKFFFLYQLWTAFKAPPTQQLSGFCSSTASHKALLFLSLSFLSVFSPGIQLPFSPEPTLIS